MTEAADESARLLTARQVAIATGWTEYAVRTAARSGDLRACRAGRQVRFHPAAVERWMGVQSPHETTMAATSGQGPEEQGRSGVVGGVVGVRTTARRNGAARAPIGGAGRVRRDQQDTGETDARGTGPTTSPDFSYLDRGPVGQRSLAPAAAGKMVAQQQGCADAAGE